MKAAIDHQILIVSSTSEALSSDDSLSESDSDQSEVCVT